MSERVTMATVLEIRDVALAEIEAGRGHEKFFYPVGMARMANAVIDAEAKYAALVAVMRREYGIIVEVSAIETEAEHVKGCETCQREARDRAARAN